MSDGFRFNNNLTYALGAGAFTLGGAGAFFAAGAGADSITAGPDMIGAEPHEEQPDEITAELPQLDTGAQVDTTGAHVDTTGAQVDTTGAHVDTGAHGAGRQLFTLILQLLW
ncbi:hypothetical protein MNBD_PLANCTO02-1792 [hydrothermal vent metagenome]|uniref:Uncharacterized protein n=1 Tax=hydrothermal vent metagenome TaxID=652676 RepID=A0A3B1DW51_9ZZZZ